MNISWINMTFKPYCERIGLELLPDDLRFIAKYLSYIPMDRRKIVMKQYCEEWKQGMSDEKSQVAKTNSGRRRANSYLREAVGDKM
jgi:hypothetical protein